MAAMVAQGTCHRHQDLAELIFLLAIRISQEAAAINTGTRTILEAEPPATPSKARVTAARGRSQTEGRSRPLRENLYSCLGSH
mmetsp:Transcript_16638/g.39181  ORF Transcript_16638/g.39181 Transcript_16638/m.39181 type:complete len:83 (+) Transcript_16638:1-249(+)